jgi:hypothetical protein
MTATTYSIPAFTISSSLCSLTYTMTLSSGATIDSTFITFYAGTPSISVSTSDASKVGLYTLRIIGTITSYSTN